MNTKPLLIKAAFAIGLITVLSAAFAFSTDKQSQEQPQEVVTSDSYIVVDHFCEEYCTAKIQADDTQIYVEYKLDDASVEFLDILNVVRDDVTINAYVDRSEIQKINAAIVGSK